MPVYELMRKNERVTLMALNQSGGIEKCDYNVSAQKTLAVRKNVRGMNAPIVYKPDIIPTDFSSGIWNLFWPDVLPSAEIQCTALLFQEKRFQ